MYSLSIPGIHYLLLIPTLTIPVSSQHLFWLSQKTFWEIFIQQSYLFWLVQKTFEKHSYNNHGFFPTDKWLQRQWFWSFFPYLDMVLKERKKRCHLSNMQNKYPTSWFFHWANDSTSSKASQLHEKVQRIDHLWHFCQFHFHGYIWQNVILIETLRFSYET